MKKVCLPLWLKQSTVASSPMLFYSVSLAAGSSPGQKRLPCLGETDRIERYPVSNSRTAACQQTTL